MKNWTNLTPLQVASIVEHDKKRAQLIKEVQKDWKDKPKKKKK